MFRAPRPGDEVTLGLFLRLLLAQLSREMPEIPSDQWPLHSLFYALKKTSSVPCVSQLVFESNGPRPWSPYLAECWQSLSSWYTASPRYATVVVPAKVVEAWSAQLQDFDAAVQNDIAEAVAKARAVLSAGSCVRPV